MSKLNLSVTIITLNEIKNIERAINSVKNFADEVIVVDSNSTDGTTELAKRLGAKVVVKEFMGYGQQKNYAMSLTKNDWVLNIDADEEVSPELIQSISSVMSNSEGHKAYKISRLTNYCGRWIKHGGWYPGYITRLCNKTAASWTEPNVHEDLKLKDQSEYGYLNGDLYHYSFPSIKDQVNTNLKYAELAAKDLYKKNQRRPFIFEMLFRPVFKFIECYFWKLGFLDRSPGLIIAVNSAHCMFLKYAMLYLEEKRIVASIK